MYHVLLCIIVCYYHFTHAGTGDTHPYHCLVSFRFDLFAVSVVLKQLQNILSVLHFFLPFMLQIVFSLELCWSTG